MVVVFDFIFSQKIMKFKHTIPMTCLMRGRISVHLNVVEINADVNNIYKFISVGHKHILPLHSGIL